MIRDMIANGPIRGAVLGYGGVSMMGKNHAEWMEGSGIPLVAICDVNPERLEAARRDYPGARLYSDLDRLLEEDEANLIVVVLPHNMHAEAAVACAEAGKHCVVEKPMCTSVADANRMIAAAEAAGTLLSVFQARRHDGDFLAIRELTQKGMIGDLFHIEASMGNYGKPDDWWRSNKKISGGNLYDWGAHFLDWILELVPSSVDDVSGFFKSDYWTDVSNEDHTQAILRFKNGCVADLQVSSLASVPKPKWRILGTKGGISAQWSGEITAYVDHRGHLASFAVPPKPTDWGAYYQNIAAHLLRGEALEVKPEQARRTIAIMEAAEKSAATGKSVRPEFP